jgi:hypothetical protein
MPNFDNLRKQAKLLVRWHRAGNYSVGGRIRSLPRYRNLTDVEALALKFPLSEAQEILALESGYESWAALKSGFSTMEEQAQAVPAGPVLKGAMPVVFVLNVQTSAAFFRDKLGFAIDFLHGLPPFYASVSRGAARLHLRFVHDVEDIKGLFAEYKAAGVDFVQPLRKEPWGGSAFIVRDPDGNCICFAG